MPKPKSRPKSRKGGRSAPSRRRRAGVAWKSGPLGDRAAVWAAARAPEINRLLVERFASGAAVAADDVEQLFPVESVLEIL